LYDSLELDLDPIDPALGGVSCCETDVALRARFIAGAGVFGDIRASSEPSDLRESRVLRMASDEAGRSVCVEVLRFPSDVAGLAMDPSMEDTERENELERPSRAEEIDDVETILEEES